MNWLRTLFLTLLLLGSAALLMAQDNDGPQIYLIDYMKATPGMDYEGLEMGPWADIHRMRVADGATNGWLFFQVRFSGSESEYDYVTVTGVQGWDALDAMYAEGHMEKYWNRLPDDKKAIAENTLAYRDLVRTDVIVAVNGVNGPNYSVENFPKYAMVNFMDVPYGKWEAYRNMEVNMARPLHEAAMKAGGSMASWGLYRVWMPSGADRPYDAITTDFFNSWSDMGGNAGVDMEELFSQVHPNISMDFFEDQIESTRRLIRRECWVVKESVFPSASR